MRSKQVSVVREIGAADKAGSLAGCKTLYRQLPGFGRLAYPVRAEATKHDVPGRRSPGCPAGVFAAVDTVIAVKGFFNWVDPIWVSPAGMKVCWKRRRASSPRAAARPFGLRGLTPASASNRGPPCDRCLDVAQQPSAMAGSKGLPVFRTPKHNTNSLRIAATTICLGLRRPRDFNRATSATIAGLYRMADIAGM